MPRASLVEKRARALCVELTRVTANTPMEYWMVRLIARLVATDYETADAAIAHAVVERGWLVGEGDPPLDCHAEAFLKTTPCVPTVSQPRSGKCCRPDHQREAIHARQRALQPYASA